MPVVFLITIAAVLVGVFFAATGRGGELAYEHADHAPLDLGPVSSADIALLRPPTALWGYNMQVTDEALDRIARAMRERDVTIAVLQEQLATLARNGVYAEPADVYAEPEDVYAEPEDAYAEPEDAYAGQVPETPEASEVAEAPAIAPESPDDLETPEFPPAPETPGPAGPVQAPEPAEPAGPPRTPLVLKASPAKARPVPDHEVTQPSEILHDPDHDATQPTQALPPHEAQGPQGAFNTHDWWAEQEKAARGEAGRRQAAGSESAAGDDSLAAAEEQGW